MAKEENRTSHSNAISVTVLLSGSAAHPQAITAAAAAMTRAMVTSNLRLKALQPSSPHAPQPSDLAGQCIAEYPDLRPTPGGNQRPLGTRRLCFHSYSLV